MWLLAVGVADWRVCAGVSSFAVANCTGVFLGGVVLGTDSTGMAVICVAFGRVPVLLALVALGGGAKGYVFGEIVFAVEQGKAGGTKGLLGHFTDEGDNHR